MKKRYPIPGTSHELLVSQISDPGCVRTHNEDAVGVFTQNPSCGYLFVVADGMGGGPAGELASRMAVDVVSEICLDSSDESEIPATLQKGIETANQRILEKSESDPDLISMGTTCTVAALRGLHLYIGHTGDTRAYLIRKGTARQLTLDQAVAQKVRDGQGTVFETRKTHMLSSYLGAGGKIHLEVTKEPLVLGSGDSFLLCSDGLYDLVSDMEMMDAVFGNSPDDACESLVGLAKERGGPDNISVIVVVIQESQS